MSLQSRLERYEQRTEWPLAAVAVAEDDTANQAATTVQINELRQQIRKLADSVNAGGGGANGKLVEGNR